jgi:hypothetical protein
MAHHDQKAFFDPPGNILTGHCWWQGGFAFNRGLFMQLVALLQRGCRVIEATAAPKRYPTCDHPQSVFELVAENYLNL